MYLIFLRKKAPMKRAHYLPAARPKRPRKRGPRKEYCAWKCTTKIDCDLFHDESIDGLTLEENKFAKGAPTGLPAARST